ncbi:Thioredoxin [Klenkia marina]|uniref:Thioredoxin n=1 Tax=Klenkia marina TaxID=1960309 RepID=A0A1G4XYG7_9ACTN|nr:Thioredoxin [Klenkia marina]
MLGPLVDATGALVLGLALLVAGVAAWWLRTRSGAVRTTGAGVSELEVLRSLGVRPEDADLTVVQFATAFCAPCRATKARLEQLRTSHPGLAAVHVDAESQLEAVRALDVRRTPTLFYLDRSGALLGRSSGAPRPDELRALVAAHAPATGAV